MLDIKMEVSKITNVESNYYSGSVFVGLEGVKLAEAVTTDEAIKEFGADELLDEIGHEKVINWLNKEGFDTTER